MISLKVIPCIVVALSLLRTSSQQQTSTSSSLLLTITPNRGHMLGGTLVTISGPIFTRNEIRVRFNDNVVQCVYVSLSSAQCVTPMMLTNGYVNVFYYDPTQRIEYVTTFYIENPLISQQDVWFDDNSVFDKDSLNRLKLYWNSSLFPNMGYYVMIRLYGYREFANTTDFQLLQTLNSQTQNDGNEQFTYFQNLERDFKVGVFQVSYSSTEKETPILWSRPVPLGWYLRNKISQNYYGISPWVTTYCADWALQDKVFGNFTAGLTACPCTLNEAKNQPQKYMADLQCDQWYNSNCYGSRKVTSCIMTRYPTNAGAAQQCCYDSDGNIVANDKDRKTGFPSRAHPFGMKPYNLVGKVPAFSHLENDLAPYLICCKWQNVDDNSCYLYRERRPPSNCLRYPYPL